MDREAWRAAVHGVAKSRTRLSDWTELNWILTKTTSHHSSPLISYLITPLPTSGLWTGLPAVVPALSDLVSKEKPSHSYYNIQIMVQLAPNLPMLRLIPSHNNNNKDLQSLGPFPCWPSPPSQLPCSSLMTPHVHSWNTCQAHPFWDLAFAVLSARNALP